MKITIMALIPDRLMEELVKCLADFDDTHPGCTFGMVAEGNLDVEEVGEFMKKYFHTVDMRKKPQ